MRKFLFLLLVPVLLAGCMARWPEPTEATTETTAAPTVETTTVATTIAATEPATVATTEPGPVYHSGLKADGSFDEGTWFIGDSMTCILVENYLTPMGLIGEANYAGKYGAHVTAFFDGTRMSHYSYNHCAFRPEHEEMTYEAVGAALGEKATAIYIMFGTNYFEYQFSESYSRILDYLLETCPNATIHMQLIPWGHESTVKYEEVNGLLRAIYERYREQGVERLMLIDTFTAIGRNPDEGLIHLAPQGNENWYKAICDHAREQGLSQ